MAMGLSPWWERFVFFLRFTRECEFDGKMTVDEPRELEVRQSFRSKYFSLEKQKCTHAEAMFVSFFADFFCLFLGHS